MSLHVICYTRRDDVFQYDSANMSGRVKYNNLTFNVDYIYI